MIRIEHILEKGSGRINEDRLVIGENIFGVFDGATSLNNADDSPTGPDLSGETGGSLAAAIASDVFAANHHPLDILGQSANTAILERMKHHNINPSRPELVWSTSAAVVRIKQNRLEWFQTGDAHILLVYRHNGHKLLAERENHDFETLCLLKTETDKTLANPALRQQALRVRAGMNKHYGVLNGDPAALSFAAGGSEPLDRVATVLLFTDGLSLPSPVPEREKNVDALASDFRRLGLRGLHEKIRATERSDPDREFYPRFKCHDDIAAIALYLG